jgi:hypothetical protein
VRGRIPVETTRQASPKLHVRNSGHSTGTWKDRGGDLALIDGRLRLVEAMALPSEEVESRLGERGGDSACRPHRDLHHDQRREEALGKGQQDVFPVAQFEKLWGGMTALPEWDGRFVRVSRAHGQQLKEPAQLDRWLLTAGRLACRIGPPVFTGSLAKVAARFNRISG